MLMGVNFLMTPDHVRQQIEAASDLYHRLVLLVAPAGSGKTGLLTSLSAQLKYPYVNVNLELSRRMLDLTAKQRALQVGTLLGELLAELPAPVLLDNTEVLFDRSLQQDPLRLLKELSRNKTLVATWNGVLNSEGLTYAVPGHPEYRRYSHNEIDFLSVSSEGTVS
jgi:hypothetical protein